MVVEKIWIRDGLELVNFVSEINVNKINIKQIDNMENILSWCSELFRSLIAASLTFCFYAIPFNTVHETIRQ